MPLAGVRASALQFRYLFVTDDAGLHVVDVTDPTQPRLVAGRRRARWPTRSRVYVARTFAYVAAGKEGLAIVDVERPEAPKLYSMFTADGTLNDARDVVVGSTNASLFAYVADGVNGLKVLQLTSPETQPKFYGFSPDPKPQLIAWRNTATPALALSQGPRPRPRRRRDRRPDRRVRPHRRRDRSTPDEMSRFYRRPDGTVWTVTDEVRMQDFVPARTVAGSRAPATPAQ